MEESVKQMIVREFKEAGLEIAEESAIKLVEIAFEIAPKIVIKTENKFDDMLIPVFELVKPKILEALKKIDGK
jgi:hypothetical protein